METIIKIEGILNRRSEDKDDLYNKNYVNEEFFNETSKLKNYINAFLIVLYKNCLKKNNEFLLIKDKRFLELEIKENNETYVIYTYINDNFLDRELCKQAIEAFIEILIDNDIL